MMNDDDNNMFVKASQQGLKVCSNKMFQFPFQSFDPGHGLHCQELKIADVELQGLEDCNPKLQNWGKKKPEIRKQD